MSLAKLLHASPAIQLHGLSGDDSVRARHRAARGVERTLPHRTIGWI